MLRQLHYVLFIVCIGLVAKCNCTGNDEDYPDITDLFSFLPTVSPNASAYVDKNNNNVYKNMSFDIDKLDLDEFNKNIDALAAKFAANETNQNKLHLNETRRYLPYISMPSGHQTWLNAFSLAAKRKVLDNMLQLIYMARHKIRELESHKLFNVKDTSYRIAFLYRRLRRYWKRIMDIYSQSVQYQQHGYYRDYDNINYKTNDINYQVQFHHFAAKFHVDFLYFFWILIRIHERYTKRSHIIMTRPTSTTTEYSSSTTVQE